MLLELTRCLSIRPSSGAIAPQPTEPPRNATSPPRAKAGGMRLDSVRLSMLLIGVSFACYSPSLDSLQDQAYKSAVVIEGKVQSTAGNVSVEPHGVNVKVLEVWPLNSGGLEREQLVTVGGFGSEAPCSRVKKNHKYIFFMEPTDEPLVFRASFAPLDTSGKNLRKDVGRILCEDCGKFMLCGVQPGRTSGGGGLFVKRSFFCGLPERWLVSRAARGRRGASGRCVRRVYAAISRQLSQAPIAHMINQTLFLSFPRHSLPLNCIRHAPRTVAHQELQLVRVQLSAKAASPCFHTFRLVSTRFFPLFSAPLGAFSWLPA